MYITIRDPNVSKSGKSINFQFKEKWHSFQLKLLKPWNLSVDEINGKTILVSDENIDIKNDWIMVREFSIENELNPKISEKNQKNNNDNNISKDYQEPKYNTTNDFNSINPLGIQGKKYSDNYSKVSWKITAPLLKNAKESQSNSIISAAQNFISRSINSKSPNKAKYSFISILVLETMKHSNEKISIFVPKYLIGDCSSSILDAQYYIDIFNVLTENKNSIISKDILKISLSDQVQLIDFKGNILFEANLIEKESNNSISFIRKKTIIYKNLLDNKEIVNNLLRLSFGNSNNKIRKFKDEQIMALNILMHDEGNVLAILKTGFGKSLIYQFATLLQPRVFINIFPIIALVKDQSKSLIDEFKLNYSINNDELKTITDLELNSDILYTKRLFLITPERIENQKMQDYFTSLGEYIGYMVFDEAHCISEWGHDFRPSYLMSKRLLENLTLAYNIKVIALTATAAPHIQKEISKLLNIPRKNILNIANSSGLKRNEMKYDIKHIHAKDFDKWNRSKTYSDIIDKHVMKASKEYKQLIIFHIKSGSENDMEKHKYKMKISARSTYERLTEKGLKNISLFTGAQKLLNNNLENDFKKLSSSKHIIATKSFGMGINLINCNYVLLTEPPYSLEDLYQQSGRVGRAGQDSLVEILYHDNVLIDPYLKQSPYNYFLLIKKSRKIMQPLVFKELVKIIEKNEEPFTINIKDFLNDIGKDAKSEHLMWAIAHLITSFKIIDKYSIEYLHTHKKSIHITPIKHLGNIKNEIKRNLDKMRIISKSDSLNSLIDSFYENYFKRLQIDKLTGINIFINKLLESDISENDNSELITNVLTEYYKTKLTDSDKYVAQLMELLIKKQPFDKIIKFIKNTENEMSLFEIMEIISRYEIDFEYIITGSALLNIIHGEKMLATSWNEIFSHKFKRQYLENLILEIINYGTNNIKTKEIKNENIKEKLDMIAILKGLKNGR